MVDNDKRYFGWGVKPRSGGSPDVYVTDSKGVTRPLTLRMVENTTGFWWGEGNPQGNSDLSRSILYDVMEAEPVPWMVDLFRVTFIDGWTMREEACWSLRTNRILNWIKDVATAKALQQIEHRSKQTVM